MISLWQALPNQLPSNIFNFCRKVMTLCLPNKSNLYRWKITEENQYLLCHHMQTQLHVLLNCEKCLNRYIWRHDSVLNSLLQQFPKILKTSSQIYCDSNKLQCNTTSQLLTTLGLDEMVVTELIIGFEINTLNSREYNIK